MFKQIRCTVLPHVNTKKCRIPLTIFLSEALMYGAQEIIIT